MGIATSIKNWFKPSEKREAPSGGTPVSSGLTSSRKVFFDLFKSGGSTFDQNITSDNAIELSTVWGCVRIISSTIASLQLDVYKESESEVIKAINHPLHKIINRKPYPLYNAYTYQETTTIHEELYGNAYALKLYNPNGTIRGLKILDPLNVVVYHIQDRLVYQVTDTDGNSFDTKFYDQDDIIHQKYMTKNGFFGLSPISTCAETFEEGMHARSFNNNFYSKGAHMAGVISYQGSVKKENIEALRKQWEEKQQGLENQGKPLVLDNGATFHALSISQKDAEFLETRKFNREEICSIFGVPLHMIGAMDRATFNNVEQMAIEFVEHAIRPRVKRKEAELCDKLFTEEEKDQGYYVRYNIESLLRGDIKTRMEMYNQMWNMAALSPNEIRKMENMNPVKGGDKFYAPLNMVDPKSLNQEEE